MTRRPRTGRVNHGGGHSYLLDGQPTTGVTTNLGDGYPKPFLIGWSANTTAAYAIDHWDELAELATSERLKRLQRARYEDRDAAANRGTEVHTLAEQLVAGEEVEVPEPLAGHVESYVKFLNEWEPDPLVVEGRVFSRLYRYGGTFDLIADLADGQRWLLDIKTSRSGVYPEAALQIAAYRYADFYLEANDGTEHPMPDVGATGVVWVRADGYDLHPVDAGPDRFRTFLYCTKVAAYTRLDRSDIIGDALPAPQGVNP